MDLIGYISKINNSTRFLCWLRVTKRNCNSRVDQDLNRGACNMNHHSINTHQWGPSLTHRVRLHNKPRMTREMTDWQRERAGAHLVFEPLYWLIVFSLCEYNWVYFWQMWQIWKGYSTGCTCVQMYMKYKHFSILPKISVWDSLSEWISM